MDRIKSICIEEELCQSHDGSLEQILKQMLSYKKLYNVILRADALMADAWHHRSDALSSVGCSVY